MTATNLGTRQPQAANRRKLTPLFVDKAAPAECRVRVWDTVVQGLVLQVEPSGSKNWYAYYRRNGRPRWHRLGAAGGLSLTGARDAVRHLNARMVLDPTYDPQAEKIASRTQGTVGDLVERYVTGHLAKLKSGPQGTFLLRRFVVPKIGMLPAAEIKRSDIRSLLNGVSSPSTRQQVLANVSGMFNWAIRNELLATGINPAFGIEQYKGRPRERVLSDSELPAFWQAFDEAGFVARCALRMILLTGQRPGEVRHMRWQDIDVGEHRLTDDNGRPYTAYGSWWTLVGEPSADGTWPGTKNGQSHRVWLSGPVLEILKLHDLIVHYQIFNSRLPDIGKRRPFEIAQEMYDTTLLQAHVIRLFPFARAEVSIVPKDEFSREDMIHALRNSVGLANFLDQEEAFQPVSEMIDRCHTQ